MLVVSLKKSYWSGSAETTTIWEEEASTYTIHLELALGPIDGRDCHKENLFLFCRRGEFMYVQN